MQWRDNMFKLHKSEIMRVDKYLIREWSEYADCPGQRRHSQADTRKLMKRMNEGVFLQGDLVFAKKTYDGSNTIRMNGQHQMPAFLQSTLRSMEIRYRLYTCYTPDDVSRLYRQIDTERKRSKADCLRVEAIALELGWSLEPLKKIGAAIGILENKGKITIDDIIKAIPKYKKQGDFINGILNDWVPKDVSKSKITKHISRVPVVTSMMNMYEVSPTDAKTFCTQLRDGENLKTRHPAYKLREYLLNTNVYRGRGAQFDPALRHRHYADEYEIRSKCITAWNAFRAGKPTSLKYYVHKPIPKAT